MHILSLTKLQKKKLREMILYLFPTYKYVNISKNGIISLRKSFWWYILFMSKKVDITEMCLVMLPDKLSKIRTKPAYDSVFNTYSHMALNLIHLNKANTVVDFLYTTYVNLKYNIVKVYNTEHNLLPEKTIALFKCTNMVLSPLSNLYSKERLKKWKEAYTTITHPVLSRNTLNMWFKQEVKKQLNKIYELQLTLSYST